jgi:hypothetical protein
MATLRACPGACTRISAPRSAQAWARQGRVSRSESAWRQRLAFVAVEQHHVARLGLRAAQLQLQSRPFHLARASWRPVRLWRGRRHRKPLFAAARSNATAPDARPCALRSRHAAAARSSSAGPAPARPGSRVRRPTPVRPARARGLGPKSSATRRRRLGRTTLASAALRPPRHRTLTIRGTTCQKLLRHCFETALSAPSAWASAAMATTS